MDEIIYNIQMKKIPKGNQWLFTFGFVHGRINEPIQLIECDLHENVKNIGIFADSMVNKHLKLD